MMSWPSTANTIAILTWTAVLALFYPIVVVAQSDPKPTLVIGQGSLGYVYLGCYNETLDITNDRAIYGGNVTKSTGMTVQKCLEACKARNYNYAGLEYTSECWCGPYLSDLSQRLEDTQCDLGCAGNNSEACGGALRVSVYKLESNSAVRGSNGLVSIHSVAALVSAVCIVAIGL
ncbi:hypothetical protein TWF569_011067 [Orbilia oligospora]|uniref:WSC domain-containing protein n=1 Tax=Orbilia oligospora TaxID=2813651 RepID=A0A7C8MUN0_ORBOL|nr:hypothetical protein TWF102_003270 [Orbilia oligospora]KAF3094090.1 hypothetical protein TWF706_008622 [Orbilia oligospora]KAF3096083.1 hypothetical protein TWF103_009976 [Orbilia oligospora]KAF3131911.1 hypothetical protein TWF569_011067 [Orbilia oligospora]KAF3131934.1 hypothetical protein TWF594_009652 [Orbilia oligospora]